MYSSTAYINIADDDNQTNEHRHWTPIVLS